MVQLEQLGRLQNIDKYFTLIPMDLIHQEMLVTLGQVQLITQSREILLSLGEH